MNEKITRKPKTARQIMYDYVGEHYGWNLVQASLMEWQETDDLIHWFVQGLFDGDKDDLLECLGEEDYKTIMNRYNKRFD